MKLKNYALALVIVAFFPVTLPAHNCAEGVTECVQGSCSNGLKCVNNCCIFVAPPGSCPTSCSVDSDCCIGNYCSDGLCVEDIDKVRKN